MNGGGCLFSLALSPIPFVLVIILVFTGRTFVRLAHATVARGDYVRLSVLTLVLDSSVSRH